MLAPCAAVKWEDKHGLSRTRYVSLTTHAGAVQVMSALYDQPYDGGSNFSIITREVESFGDKKWTLLFLLYDALAVKEAGIIALRTTKEETSAFPPFFTTGKKFSRKEFVTNEPLNGLCRAFPPLPLLPKQKVPVSLCN